MREEEPEQMLCQRVQWSPVMAGGVTHDGILHSTGGVCTWQTKMQEAR
jgi:hypothetical protein